MNRTIRAALALGCVALPLTACNSDQEQQALTGLNLACAGLQVGTTVVVQVASSVGGATPVASVAGTVGAISGAACSTLIPAVMALVDNITKAGGTAMITATATNPVTLKRTVRTAQVMPTGQVIFTGTVPPGFALPF